MEVLGHVTEDQLTAIPVDSFPKDVSETQESFMAAVAETASPQEAITSASNSVQP